MDFTNALYLTATVFGVVTLAKVLLNVSNPRLVCGIVVIASFAATFLMAETVWADEQVIGSYALGELDFWSKVSVALFLAGAETAVFLGVEAVKNVGQNHDQP